MSVTYGVLERPRHLEPGTYEILVRGVQVGAYRGRLPKVVLDCDPIRGPFVEGAWRWEKERLRDSYLPTNGFDHPRDAIVRAFFNVTSSNPDGTVAAGWHSDFMNLYVTRHDKVPKDPSRLDPSVLLGTQWVVVVTTVTETHEKRTRHLGLHYSKVDHFLRFVG